MYVCELKLLLLPSTINMLFGAHGLFRSWKHLVRTVQDRFESALCLESEIAASSWASWTIHPLSFCTCWRLFETHLAVLSPPNWGKRCLSWAAPSTSNASLRIHNVHDRLMFDDVFCDYQFSGLRSATWMKALAVFTCSITWVHPSLIYQRIDSIMRWKKKEKNVTCGDIGTPRSGRMSNVRWMHPSF